MRFKNNFGNTFRQKIAIFLLSICIIVFSYISYQTESSFNFIKTIGEYVDDSLLYKRIYLDNNHNNELVIVKIDEKTLNSAGKNDLKLLSFSKEMYAQVIETLFEKYQVKNIGVDIIFANTSYYGEQDEQILKDTLEKYKNKVVVASRGDMSEIPLCIYNGIQHGAIEIAAENRVRKTKISYPNYNSGLSCDSDLEVVDDSLNRGIQAFGVEVYKQYVLNETNLLKAQKNIVSIEKNLSEQARINDGFLNFNYSTNKEKNEGTFGFQSYSLIDILDKKDIDLRGKIILIGEVGTVLHDLHFTPINFKYQMPGVELHANIITSLLYDSSLQQIQKSYILIIAYLSCLFLLIIILTGRTLINGISLILFMLLHLVLALELFVGGMIYPVFFMCYTLILSFIVGYVYKFIVTDKNRRFLKKAFSMYISPDMVDMIYKDPSKLNLKGEKGNITLFFSDIANFTNISESMKTEELFDFLNNYFSEMTRIMLRNRGTLDKYIGDAIMGFYNAPLSVENHEYLACKTALEQIQKLQEINIKNKELGLPNIAIRIGINTGEAMHGNLGSSGKKINYTAIGDSVNIASRLEGINKQYGSTILISEHTYSKVKNDFLFRELDTIQVKGKNTAIKIYELLGDLTKKDELQSMISNYKSGLHLYYQEKYTEAIIYFKKNTGDLVSTVMKKRCEAVLSGNETVKQGVYKFDTK